MDPLMREAIAWVVRLRSGEATKAELAHLEAWRAQSSEHDDAFRQAALLWRDLKAAANQVADQRAATPFALRSLNPAQWSVSRRFFIGGAVAASAAAYFVYEPPMDLWPSLREFSADYRTGKGEKRDVTVAEGVTATLNTMTSVSVLSSSSADPRIELIAGEALVKAERRIGENPLIVRALGARLVATQASFQARCLDGRVSVTCLDGHVDVEYERSVVRLIGGRQVDVSSQTGLGLAFTAEPDVTTAWQHGLLIVRDRPLAAVVDEVNRYRTGRIIVTNAALGRRLMSGTFHIERLDNFPIQVRELFGAGVHNLPGGIVLLT
jgi:transmembrane sensor